MALILTCPCGNPLDCDGLEVLVTVNCPRCSREFALEVQAEDGRRRFAVLTVMEGPYWVGERFVMPVAETLHMGKAADNWLSFESDELAPRHCKIAVSPRGRVDVESLVPEKGVWIGDACIMRGRLLPQESMRIGEYRLRLDYVDAIGGETIVEDVDEDSSLGLPTMSQVGMGGSPAGWIVRNRFVLARWSIFSFAWLVAALHVTVLSTRSSPPAWELPWAIVAGVGVLVPLLISGRRVTLVHRHLRYLAIGLLVLLALIDTIVWQLPSAGVGALLLAAALSLLALLVPSPGLGVLAAAFCIVSVALPGILFVQGAIALLRS